MAAGRNESFDIHAMSEKIKSAIAFGHTQFLNELLTEIEQSDQHGICSANWFEYWLRLVVEEGYIKRELLAAFIQHGVDINYTSDGFTLLDKVGYYSSYFAYYSKFQCNHLHATLQRYERMLELGARPGMLEDNPAIFYLDYVYELTNKTVEEEAQLVTRYEALRFRLLQLIADQRDKMQLSDQPTNLANQPRVVGAFNLFPARPAAEVFNDPDLLDMQTLTL